MFLCSRTYDPISSTNASATLNPTASFLWDVLAQPRTVGELTVLLTEEFDVSPEIARKDVTLFLEMLQRTAMVTVYEDA